MHVWISAYFGPDLLRKSFVNPTHFNWKWVLVKTERQGVHHLYELSDAWHWDLAYESRAWIEAKSHETNEYD